MPREFKFKMRYEIDSSIDDNIDVDIFVGSERYTATFFTLKNVETLLQKFSKSGECANGTYFWASDMILVKEITEEVIQKTITDLLKNGELKKAVSTVETLGIKE